MSDTVSEMPVRKPITLKKRIEMILRKIGLEPLIYYFVFWKDRRKHGQADQAFSSANPSLKLPPARLRFDVIACGNAEYYVKSGTAMAAQIFEVIQKWAPANISVVCEWGCGPGRVLLPLASMFSDKQVKFIGSDMYAPSVRWAQSIQDGKTVFHLNMMNPPLPIADKSVDFVYAISVFTHLSEDLSRVWLKDIMRVLKPGGVFWFSAHSGESHRPELDDKQLAALDRGEFVAIHSKHDGSQMYTGIHTPKLMKDIIASSGAELLEYQPRGNNKYQDAWIVRKI